MSIYLKKQKRVLKKILVGLSLFFIGMTIFYCLTFLLRHYDVPSAWIRQPVYAVFVMTVVALLAYKPLDLATTMLFKNYLFKQKSYRHITLMNLAEELSVILDFQELANLVVNTFGDVLHLKTVALATPSRLRGDFEIASAYGWNISDARHVRLPENSPLVTFVRTNGPHVLVRDRVIRIMPWQEANHLSHNFDQLAATWVIPLFVKEDLTGLIAFSAKTAEIAFDEADFQFFREFADKIAKCVRNSLSVWDLQIANEELQDIQSQILQNTKLNAIEQLASGIAHEIHNPLTIISGKAQVLLLQKNNKALDERVEEVLKTIVRQTKRAADITRKLLMFSQGSGAPKETLSLEHILDDTLALVSYRTSLEGIEVTKSLGTGIPPFYGNIHELREVFLNLVLNAVQSVGSQGKIHISMMYQTKDQIIEIQVQDSGCGIAPDLLDKLFNPFFTTRDDAVGLGLFVTKQIVHRYGGSIRAESRPGEGSIFIVRFPYLEGMGEPRAPRDKTFSLFPS